MFDDKGMKFEDETSKVGRQDGTSDVSDFQAFGASRGFIRSVPCARCLNLNFTTIDKHCARLAPTEQQQQRLLVAHTSKPSTLVCAF